MKRILLIIISVLAVSMLVSCSLLEIAANFLPGENNPQATLEPVLEETQATLDETLTFNQTEVGQKVTLTILRDGDEKMVELNLQGE